MAVLFIRTFNGVHIAGILLDWVNSVVNPRVPKTSVLLASLHLALSYLTLSPWFLFFF